MPGYRLRRGRNSTEHDLKSGLTTTGGPGSGFRTLTRPQSSSINYHSLLYQEERDLKWMKVQENSITRSEEKLVRYKQLLNKHEKSEKYQEKFFDEKRRDQKREARSVQMKREMVKSYKDKT